MGLGLIHITKKKRDDQDDSHLELPQVKMILLDDLGYVVGVLTAFANIPQVIEIWLNKNAAGVSSVSWVGFTLASIFWLYYGMQHKQKVIVFTFSFTLLLQFLVVLGSFIY